MSILLPSTRDEGELENIENASKKHRKNIDPNRSLGMTYRRLCPCAWERRMRLTTNGIEWDGDAREVSPPSPQPTGAA